MKDELKTIRINGISHKTDRAYLNYNDILQMAKMKGKPTMVMSTIVTSKIVNPDEQVFLVDGANFNIQHTGNA